MRCGAVQNGWLLAHADKPARVAEAHSETPGMTRRAMDFMAEAHAESGHATAFRRSGPGAAEKRFVG